MFLNAVPVESNAYFGLYKCLKSYLSTSCDELNSRARNSFYKNYDAYEIPDDISADDFDPKKCPKGELKIIKECKRSIHFITNLNLDMSSCQTFLMDGVDVRIRLDLCSPALLINSYDAEKYIYKIDITKLWGDKIIPFPSALTSLNKSLIAGRSIEYLFSRPLIRSYVYPTNYNSLTLDNIFTGTIPQAVYVFFMKQSNATGSYCSNGSYFDHANVENLSLEVNGNNMSILTGQFPDHVALMYQNMIASIKTEGHQIPLQYFKKGRTVHAFDLRSSEATDTIPLEKSGNVRLSIQSSKPNTENIIIYIIGVTTALVSIDHTRAVKTSYLM